MIIGWLYTPLGCTRPPPAEGGCTRGVSAKRFEPPLVGGAARLWRRGGNPPAPAFPRRGETGKGGTLPARAYCLPHMQMPGLTHAGNSLRPLKTPNSHI